MGYYEFTITAAPESREALIQGVADIGCLGIVERDAALTIYFPDVLGIDRIRSGLDSFRQVLAASGLDPALTCDHTFISERDWNESWKKKFQPIDVGGRFSILPPWERTSPGMINLIIDPGMAFGTGHHETTRTCLLYIDRFSRQAAKGRFLDVGTGTGVLAVAASLLGFTQVVGVDIDPLAVDAAERNVRLNAVDNIVVKEGSIDDADGSYDFIAANLLSEILIRMAPALACRLSRGGIALLSGMLTGQEEGVIEAVEREGLRFAEKLIDGRWVTVIVTR